MEGKEYGFWGATGNYESWEVRVDDANVVFKHFMDPGRDPNTTSTPHAQFLAGEGNDQVRYALGNDVLTEVKAYLVRKNGTAR